MSFSALIAGSKPDAVAYLEADNSPFVHGGRLGELTRRFLTDVAHDVPEGLHVIVEASGHSDQWGTGLNVRVLSTPALARPAPAPDAAAAPAEPAEPPL